MDPIVIAVTLYVADKLLAQFIKEEGYGKIRLLFFPKERYKIRLQNILLEVIREFQITRPKPLIDEEGKIPFYESKITFEALSTFILFKTGQATLVVDAFRSDDRIILPTQNDIDKFFEVFFRKVSADTKLKTLFVEENYKDEVFTISKQLESLTSKVDIIQENTTEILKQLSTFKNNINVINDKFNSNIKVSDFLTFIDSDLPPLIDFHTSREKVVEAINGSLNTISWIELNGGAGIGKTQLAVLLARKRGSKIIWIGLRDSNNKNYFPYVFGTLSAKYDIGINTSFQDWLAAIYEKLDNDTVIIIDDLPRIDSGTNSDKLFFEFVRTVIDRGAKILSTSNHGIAERIKQDYFEGKISNYPIPYLTEGEIEEVLVSLGASVENANNFREIVRTVSSGHPVVVTAVCRYLKANNWEMSNESLIGLFKGDYSIGFSDEISNKLVETIVDAESRELLYRLKLVNGNFTKEEVTVISQAVSPIKLPDEKISSMVGLWIQKISTDTFQLSPLIKNLREENISPSDKKSIFYSLGSNILKKKILNQFEAFNCINYFINADRFNEAGFVLTLILNESLKNKQVFFDWGFNIFWSAIALPDKMDLFLKLSIRVQQIMVFQDQKRDVEFLKNDLESLVAVGSSQGIDTTSPSLLLSTMYILSDSAKARNYFLQGIKGLNELREIKEFQKLYSESNISEELIWSLCFGIKSENDLWEWFNAFDALPDVVRLKCLESKAYDMAAVMLGQNIISEEGKKQSPEWNTILEILQKMEVRACELGLILIAANAIRYQISVLSEQINQIDRAKKIADNGLLKFNQSIKVEFLIKDAIGRQLHYKQRFEEATQYVLDATILEVPESYTEKVDTYLVASWILGKKDNVAAHYYCKKSYELAVKSPGVSDIAKARIFCEYSVSLWLNNEPMAAITTLVEANEKITSSYRSSHDYNALTIRIGHALNYYYSFFFKGAPPLKAYDGSNYNAPERGFFLTNNDIELSTAIFFDARLFINAHLCLRCYEELNDLENSKKWAYYNIRVAEGVKENPYYVVLYEVSTYLIIDNKFAESCILIKKTMDFANYMVDNKFTSSDIISNDRMKPYLDTSPMPNKRIDGIDEILLEVGIIPSLLHISRQYLINKSTGVDIARKFLSDFATIKSYFNDIGIYEKVYELVELILEENVAVQDALNELKRFNSENKNSILTVAYILLSIKADSKLAFELHLACTQKIMDSLKKGSVGAYRFIAMPFFESFWIDRLTNNSEDFEDSLKLSKQIEVQVNYEAWSKKTKLLFRIIGNGLNYQYSKKDLEWLTSN